MPSTRTRTSAIPARGFLASPLDITSEIDLTGSCHLTDAVSDEWLNAVREYVDTIPAGVHEVMLEGAAANKLPFMRQLTSNPDLLALLESVAQTVHPAGDPAQRDVECALRVLNGADPVNHPLWFHYDASVLTMVLPIDIPDAAPGQSGELIVCPNRRPYRRWALTNVIEKAVTQSDRYRRHFLRRLNWHHDIEMVPLQPGTAYLFWGYRSYHATMPVADGARRVTVVLHYKDVHPQSRVLKYAKTFYHRLRG